MNSDAHAGHDAPLKQAAAQLQRQAELLRDRVRLLEEENQTLAEMLREHGVEVHRKSSVHVELPAAITSPSPGNAEELALFTRAERRLYDEISGKDDVILLLLSESMTDVGQWMMQSRVWLFATRSELVAFAAGRKPLLQRIPFRHIQESLYNNVTGELVLAPDRKFKLSHIRFSPSEGYQFLAQIFGTNSRNQSTEK